MVRLPFALALFLLCPACSSPLMDSEYDRLVLDYDEYQNG
jgi:hypothetical protein